ncbi:hypothetical protein IHE44_0004807 [Lamprotornis superbus]|uniref:Uncharacterized protein n=1 Tax=Lamprotornis superbus TaxID=245042 RepID=A0A835NCI9_9PASS|nr:hypothetical protein IHE44_0004807 [Lamprotornis superbus]
MGVFVRPPPARPGRPEILTQLQHGLAQPFATFSIHVPCAVNLFILHCFKQYCPPMFLDSLTSTLTSSMPGSIITSTSHHESSTHISSSSRSKTGVITRSKGSAPDPPCSHFHITRAARTILRPPAAPLPTPTESHDPIITMATNLIHVPPSSLPAPKSAVSIDTDIPTCEVSANLRKSERLLTY